MPFRENLKSTVTSGYRNLNTCDLVAFGKFFSKRVVSNSGHNFFIELILWIKN